MRERLRTALALTDVDYCEIRFEESDVLSITFQGPTPDRIALEKHYGGGVRALYRGGWGFASFNDPGDLEAMVKSACVQARFAGGRQNGVSCLAPVPVIETEFSLVYTIDPHGVSVDEKVRLLAHYADLMLGFDPTIASVNIVYGERTTRLHFASSEGTYITQDKLDIGANIGAVASRDGITVTKGIGRGSSLGFDCMLNADAELREACALAVRLLAAPQVKAGVYTVICDPALTGLFVHEAFGHLSEADNTCKNEALAKAMTLGRRLGREILTIWDSGEIADQRGFLKYDDEGVVSERTMLVKDGILVGRLHSRETAGIMGERPTGSARALSYAYPPLVRMRNTSIAPGTSTFAEMIKDIELGVYAVGSGGGQTNGEMFTFNAGHGFMIRDGQLAELVRDVKLTGNVFTTLARIDKVGVEVGGRNGAGGCGKFDQVPLPTAGLCPAIRIRNVVLGGAR